MNIYLPDSEKSLLENNTSNIDELAAPRHLNKCYRSTKLFTEIYAATSNKSTKSTVGVFNKINIKT